MQEAEAPESIPEPTPSGAALVERCVDELIAEMHKAIVGQDAMLEFLVVALLAGGHVLLEGVPGTAKTLAVRTFAALCGASFARIQFTPDLMPSDIIGTSIYNQAEGRFSVKKGPLFAGIVLADEINRTPPKTQAALLESMEERQVTIDGESYRLPEPFIVCATQNPIEYEGTYPLPEAQLDRFMLKVVVGYPGADEEQNILARYESGFRAADLGTAHLRRILSTEQIPALRQQVDHTGVDEQVRRYIVEIARSARSDRRLALGPSPRCSVTLMMASKALAAMRGRDFVTPDDVKSLAPAVMRHRLMLKPESEVEGQTADRVIASVLDAVAVPR